MPRPRETPGAGAAAARPAPAATPQDTGRAMAPFELENHLRSVEGQARHAIGGSGLPTRSLGDVVPDMQDALEQAWATPADEAYRGVARRLARIYGGDESEYLVTMGASEADFLAAWALAPAGGRAIVERPAYFALLEPARAMGLEVVRVQRDATAGFAWRTQEVLDVWRPGAVAMLARPNNPTGAWAPAAELAAIAQHADEEGGHVVVDEVFAEATPAGDVPARRIHPRILSINSLTKCLGFGPLQVGWIHADADTVAHLRRAKWHVRPLNPTIDLVLAQHVLHQRNALLGQTRARRTEGVRIVRDAVERNGWTWSDPQHGTTCAIRVPDGDDLALARRLLADGVAVTPATYLEMPGWIRIGLLAPPESLEQGLAALERTMPKH